MTFKENGYGVIKGLVPKDVAEFIAKYTLFCEKHTFHPDEQVPSSHIGYSSRVGETLLLDVKEKIEKASGLSLYPTYSFYRVYRPGHELEKHRDRPSCEISVTLCLGYDYAGADYEYPIFANGEGYILEPGDAVIYRGTEIEHWREVFTAPEGSWHSQVFLHYVDANGPYQEFKYDKRNLQY